MIQVSGRQFFQFFCYLTTKNQHDQIFCCVFSHKSAEIDELQVLEHTVLFDLDHLLLGCFLSNSYKSFDDIEGPSDLGLPNPTKQRLSHVFSIDIFGGLKFGTFRAILEGKNRLAPRSFGFWDVVFPFFFLLKWQGGSSHVALSPIGKP